jgi:hypothetical protein
MKHPAAIAKQTVAQGPHFLIATLQVTYILKIQIITVSIFYKNVLQTKQDALYQIGQKLK